MGSLSGDTGSNQYSELVLSYGGGAESPLMQMLMGEDIQPGTEPSYQLCKTIYIYHPLGGKMAEGPIKLAQSQERKVTIQGAPDEAVKAFTDQWAAMEADQHILNVHALARVYGISTVILGVKDVPSNVPVEMDKIWDKDVYFNVLDPLNTSGSLVLSQNPNDPGFQRPVRVSTSGESYHPSRFKVVMNENPVFIQYTGSAFGFVGRSVYMRALFAMKSFLRSMIADDMIQSKLALLIAKQKSPGSVINNAMLKLAAWKRMLLKFATSGQVLSIGTDEDVATIDMTNVDGAGSYSRNNIIRNIETAADMPAKMLDQETMVSGFGEGTEDSKRNAQYIESIRIKMRPVYVWFNNIAQYRAWNPLWYKTVIQAKYPEEWGGIDWFTAFSQWRQAFQAEWPSLLIEPESEEIKKEEVKLEAVVAILNTLLPQLDAENKSKLIQWAADCFGENKRLFPHELELDWEALEEFQEENAERQEEAHKASLEPAEGSFGKGFKDAGDSVAQINVQIAKLREAAARLTSPRERAIARQRTLPPAVPA